MNDIKITKYEAKYKDKLIEFNRRDKNFSDYLLLTLEDEILAQLSITKCRNFYRFLDLKILKDFKLTYEIDDFIRYAVDMVRSDCDEIYTFVSANEKELLNYYKKNGFEIDETHPFNQVKGLGYVYKLLI